MSITIENRTLDETAKFATDNQAGFRAPMTWDRFRSSNEREAILFDKSKQFERGALGFIFAALPLGDEIDGDSEMTSEDGLTGHLVFANGGDLARGKRLYGRQAHLVEVPHGHFIHHACVMKIFGCFMDSREYRATIRFLRRRLLRMRRF